MLLLFIILVLIVSSAVMFNLERGIWNSDTREWRRLDGTYSPFQSIPHGFYWSIATLSTVGYGDIVPVTSKSISVSPEPVFVALGRIFAGLTMFVSIMVIAMPTSILGSNFIAEYQLFQRFQLQMKVQKNKKGRFMAPPQSQTKGQRIRILTDQNSAMVTAIAEIQEKLNDVRFIGFSADSVTPFHHAMTLK